MVKGRRYALVASLEIISSAQGRSSAGNVGRQENIISRLSVVSETPVTRRAGDAQVPHMGQGRDPVAADPDLRVDDGPFERSQ